MAAYLIPIKALSAPALAAVRFALEFGKRNGGVFYCLFVAEADGPTGAPGSDTESAPLQVGAPGPDTIRQTIESQLAQAREGAGLQIESVCRNGDYIQEVRRFVREYHIAEIILGIPEDAPDSRNQPHPDALLLHQLTHCRILTVKPKAKEQDHSWNPSS